MLFFGCQCRQVGPRKPYGVSTAFFGLLPPIRWNPRIYRVRQVAKVDTGDELLGRKIAEQSPERFAFSFGIKIPERIDDRGSREVNDASFRSEPAELRVAR